ncbi:hypothetical protein DIPPA_14760 [Diplonema papillatum]|nr:hypothetical protein DIPPA_14760 [Diplonema papillatum]
MTSSAASPAFKSAIARSRSQNRRRHSQQAADAGPQAPELGFGGGGLFRRVLQRRGGLLAAPLGGVALVSSRARFVLRLSQLPFRQG